MSIDRIPLPRTVGALWLCGRNDVGPDPEAAQGRLSVEVGIAQAEVDGVDAECGGDPLGDFRGSEPA